MVATRRSGSAGKSPSDTNEESTGGQEEPRKLRGRRLSAGNADSGKRSASPAELPEVTSAKRLKVRLGCLFMWDFGSSYREVDRLSMHSHQRSLTLSRERRFRDT